jgi:hypothetical protein
MSKGVAVALVLPWLSLYSGCCLRQSGANSGDSGRYRSTQQQARDGLGVLKVSPTFISIRSRLPALIEPKHGLVAEAGGACGGMLSLEAVEQARLAATLRQMLESAGKPDARARLEALTPYFNEELCAKGPEPGKACVSAIAPAFFGEVYLYPAGHGEANGGFVHTSKRGFECLERTLAQTLTHLELERTVALQQPATLPPPAPEIEAGPIRCPSLEHPELCETHWALDFINYDKAVAALHKRRPGVLVGSGVVVAHMDTGYTPHCQFYDAGGSSPLHPELGYDFFSTPPKPDPVDALLPGFAETRQPGHGTRTGTALASPHTASDGCGTGDWPFTGDVVWGVAPGITLVPVRVADGIVQGVPPALKRAVRGVDRRVASLRQAIYAASHDVGYVGDATRRPMVISISMGGCCGAEADEERENNYRLREATVEAERQGLIVIAAAGQYPSLSKLVTALAFLFFQNKSPVTFPGSYPSVIAIAGVDAFGRTYRDSAHGPEVAASAPAVDVWRGTSVHKSDTYQEVGTGTGTSFATAMTAGVSAMWLQYWGPQCVKEKYGPALSSAFRWVLQHGGTRTPAQVAAEWAPSARYPGYGARYEALLKLRALRHWDAGSYGKGIVDAFRILETPLPSRAVVCNAEKMRVSAGAGHQRTLDEWRAICEQPWPERECTS